jgi:ABC-2 type transport system permease protein
MRDELARQLARRRIRVLLGACVVVPLLLALVYAVRGAPELPTGATPQLLHLASSSALAFAVFVLYMCAPLLLLAIAAAFAGEAMGSERAWGTLRYLLAAPVARPVLLLRKLGASLVLAAAATALLLATSLLAGAVLFGWGPLDTPVGGSIPVETAAPRVLLATAYALVTITPFVALAILLASLLDGPLAAVGLATGVAVVSQILDTLPTLGAARVVLPTHYQLAWTQLFVDPPLPDDLAAGTLQATCYTLVAVALAWWLVARRDVTG